MSYKTIETYVSVDVDLGEFDTDDLIEELESRGKAVGSLTDNAVLVNRIYEKRRLKQDYQTELDELLYQVTGRFI